MEESRIHDTIEEYDDICFTGIVGGALGFLTPLAVFSYWFWIFPLLSFCLCAFALVRIRLHGAPMTGQRMATFGLLISLFCGSAGVANGVTFRQLQIGAACHAAEQWYTLMLAGREMEAFDLRRAPLTRAEGNGIVIRYTDPEQAQADFLSFQKESAVRLLRREFRGGTAKFCRVIQINRLRQDAQFMLDFEVSVGQGVLRKSRHFGILVLTSPSTEGRRYDWIWQRIELL